MFSSIGFSLSSTVSFFCLQFSTPIMNPNADYVGDLVRLDAGYIRDQRYKRPITHRNNLLTLNYVPVRGTACGIASALSRMCVTSIIV